MNSSRRKLTRDALPRGLLLTVILCLAGAAPLPAQEFRAAWADVFHVGMGSQTEVNNMVSALATGHYNAVVVQVVAYMDSGTSSHGAQYKSNILPWSTRVTSSFDPLAYLCTQAHANGIEVHAWLGGSAGAMYRVSTTWPPSGNTTLANNPKWFIAPPANSEGGAPVLVDGNYDLDMGSPDAQEYIVSIVKELVTNYPIDGINWDDELNSAGYTGGFGYPAYSQADYAHSGLARFRINTGYVGTPSYTNTAWSDYRRRFKNELMARVQAEIESIKTNPRQPLRHTSAALAYSPVPTSCDFTTSVPYEYYCDWAGMLQNGWLDAVIPQTYSSSTFNSWASLCASCWQYNRQIFPGIGAYLNTDATIAAEITYTRSLGLKGNCIYSYAVPNSAGTSDWWAYAAVNVYTNVVSTPPMPWRNPATATEGIVWGRVSDYNTSSNVDNATIAVTGGPTVKTDGNGYYVATLVPATTNGTTHSVTVSMTGMTSQTTNAVALAGDVVRYDLTLNAPVNTAPSITTQPQSQAVTGGGNATFTVTATGSPTLYYQWMLYGTNIANATATSYTRVGVQPADAGPYSVLVTNAFGTATSSNAQLTVIVPPTITTQPQSQTVTQGLNATFTVAASGTAPFSFQWKFAGTNVSSATLSSYTRSNVQPSDAGSYSVVVSNSAGSATSSNAILTVSAVPTPPSIISQPQGQTVNQGASATFTVSASGSTPLYYQWRWYGTNLAGATGTSYTLTATTNLSGPYTVVVTNSYGAVTSQVANLSVNPVFLAGGLSVLWSLAPGARSYLTVASPPNERGLAYDALNHRVLIVSRTSPTVYVLDADTGADLWTLNTTGVTGGYTANYYLLMIGVADDGAVYAGNLTIAGTTTAFKLYRWANDNSSTVPTVAYSGDPGAGNSQRWGDTIDVRGAGANTQVIIGARNANLAAFLTTANGTNFTSQLITVADSPAGAFGLGIAFGAGNTFWGKATSQNLRQVSFDPVAGTGATVRNYADPAFPGTIGPIGVSTNLNLLGGINVGTTGNNFRLYDLTTTNGTPVLITSTNFPTDNDNTYAGTGAVDFGGDRVYALGSDNGVLAMQIISAGNGTPPSITTQPQPQTVNQGSSATFTVSATGTAPLSYQWQFNGIPISSASLSTYTVLSAQPTNAGSYSVLITNVAGSVTSSDAALTVNVPPAITAQPQPQTVNQGNSATFTISATGTAPLSYQWQFNGSAISSATLSSYTLLGAQSTNAGSYSVIITNAAGSVTSSNATLTVNLPPAITTQPQSVSAAVGSNVTFSVAATGTAPLSYQWRFNGADLGYATASMYTCWSAQATNAGSYSVLVSNVAGMVISTDAVLTVSQPTSPQIDTISLTSDGQIQLQASGPPGLYAVVAATNLADWGDLATVTNTGTSFQYLDAETNLTQRFYRLRQVP